MRQWTRATRVLQCGLCRRRLIAVGEPVLRVQLTVVAKPLWRCVDCYGPAPPDLPLLMEPRAPMDTRGMSHVTAAKPATRGAFRSAVREWMPYREPGSDDD